MEKYMRRTQVTPSHVVIPYIKKACAPYPAVKHIIIIESGWPSRGENFGVAVPSHANEQAALKSLDCAAKGTRSSKLRVFALLPFVTLSRATVVDGSY